MTKQIVEIDSLTHPPGFQLVPTKDRTHIAFARAMNVLRVFADGKWLFYAEVVEGKQSDQQGLDFHSLQKLLTSPAQGSSRTLECEGVV
jgi:hypothetical protein